MSDIKDKELIVETVWNYLNGQNNRKYELVEKAWHDDCHMFGINAQNEVVIYPRSIWREWFAGPSDDPDAEKKAEILSLDIYKSVANAKVRTVIEGIKGTIVYTDYLNIVKISETEWKIVNKIFQTDFEPKKK
ncbi:MAG: nuclear transport factor 2 family protein [Candidatus Heimdallarchaeota archaeon]|nr:nuclear transport factor 2 family protein [Candidatus Heimdallarchaeota archaeon]MBY8996015.1 nuclear transport factor 2 family protein [Candidatus Heimdallarchaeota archaeon]